MNNVNNEIVNYWNEVTQRIQQENYNKWKENKGVDNNGNNNKIH